MDPLFTKAQIDVLERLEVLPKELVDLITDGTLDATVYTAQEKYGLTEEQTKLLENEIILVLALFLSKRTFVDHVRESLAVDEETAFGIGEIVKEEIFSLVEDILQIVDDARKEVSTAVGEVDLVKKLERRDDLSRLQQTLSAPRTPVAPIPVAPTRIVEPTPNPEPIPTPVTTPTPVAPLVDEDSEDDVEPIRTMDQDINRIHGYGAYRDQLEKEEQSRNAATAQSDLLSQENNTPRG